MLMTFEYFFTEAANRSHPLPVFLIFKAALGDLLATWGQQEQASLTYYEAVMVNMLANSCLLMHPADIRSHVLGQLQM